MTRAVPLWLEHEGAEEDSGDEGLDGEGSPLRSDGYAKLGYWQYSCSTIARWLATAHGVCRSYCCCCCCSPCCGHRRRRVHTRHEREVGAGGISGGGGGGGGGGDDHNV